MANLKKCKNNIKCYAFLKSSWIRIHIFQADPDPKHSVLLFIFSGGRMIPEELESCILAAKKRNKLPFLVNATAGSTVLGAYDDLGIEKLQKYPPYSKSFKIAIEFNIR